MNRTQLQEKPCEPPNRRVLTVIIDNLPSYKSQRADAMIRAKDAWVLFLPHYSPDLIPIEQLFAKLKHFMQKKACRSIEAAWRSVGQLLSCVTPEECAYYFTNSGYASV